MKTRIILSLLLVISFGSMAQERELSAKELKAQKKQAAYERTKGLIESGEFVFEAVWGFPQSGSLINLVGNNNRFHIKDGMAFGSMQYFGTAYTARQNLLNQNILFDGSVEDWRIITKEKNRKVIARFTTTKRRELYDMEISVAPSGNAVVIVSSSLRDPMRYEGYINPIEDSE